MGPILFSNTRPGYRKFDEVPIPHLWSDRNASPSGYIVLNYHSYTDISDYNVIWLQPFVNIWD